MADGNAALRGPTLRRRASYRALPSPGAARPCPRGPVTFSCEPPRKDEPRHFLDACALCRAPLRASRDIYMYRGDTPFCSEECRQEQIELDEVLEREASARRKMWGRGAGPTAAKAAATSVAEAVVAS